MKPASQAFQPQRIAIIMENTGCDKNQAIVALYSLEEHIWKEISAARGRRGESTKAPALQQCVIDSLTNLGIEPDQAKHYCTAIFIELARRFGGEDAYIHKMRSMLKLLQQYDE